MIGLIILSSPRIHVLPITSTIMQATMLILTSTVIPVPQIILLMMLIASLFVNATMARSRFRLQMVQV